MRIRWHVVLAAVAGLATGDPAVAYGGAADSSAAAGNQQNVLPTPVPDVPPAKSSAYPYNQPPNGSKSATSAPARSGQFAPPSNQGPVTGYGPGGMGTAPGSPANPPYSFGGTGLPR